MGRSRLLFLLLLVLLPAAASAQSNRSRFPANDAAAGTAASWSTGVEALCYLQDDGFVTPIFRADRGSLHLEGRYQYEDRETFSAWAGRNFEAGSTVRFELAPMAGVIAGRTHGLAPGLEADVAWKSLDLYAELEYVFDLEGSEGDYLYDWSQLTWQARPWLGLGLTVQRTRMYQSELAIDRGIFAAVSRGPVELSAYGFNLDGDEPFAILGLGVDF